MEVTLKPDFDISEEGCKAATGKSLSEWFAWIDANHPGVGRRDAIHFLFDETGRGKDVWWPTTLWVEYEAAKGVTQKDGRAEGYTLCSTKTVAADPEACYSACRAALVENEGPHALTWLREREGKDLRFDWTTNNSCPTTRVDVTFVDKGKGKTLITLTHARVQTRAESDGLRNAWAAFFDGLKSKLEA